MSQRVQDILVDVLKGEVRGVCSDVEEVREMPILQGGFEGMLGYEFDHRLWWWFVRTFTDDLEERARIYRAATSIRRTFLNVSRLEYFQTGQASPPPDRLIRALEMAVTNSLVGSAYQLATGARSHTMARASTALKQLTKEQQWRATSTS